MPPVRLDEYITEAVSHGLHKSACQDLPQGDSEEQIKEWLDDLGIPRGDSVNNMRLNWYVERYTRGGMTDITVCIPHGISSSYVFKFAYKQGKLKKVIRRFTSHSGEFQWRPKEYHIPCGDILTALEIYRTGKDTVKESVTHGGNANRKALDKMDDIFSDPYGMTLDDIVELLDLLGYSKSEEDLKYEDICKYAKKVDKSRLYTVRPTAFHSNTVFITTDKGEHYYTLDFDEYGNIAGGLWCDKNNRGGIGDFRSLIKHLYNDI